MNSNKFENCQKETVKNILKEQLLKEYIIRAEDSFLELYKDMFDISEEINVSMFILYPKKNAGYNNLVYLKNMFSREIVGNDLIFCSIISDMVIAVTILEEDELISLFHKMQRLKTIGDDVSAVYSQKKEITELPQIYSKLIKCIDYCFYEKAACSFINESMFEICAGDIAPVDFAALEAALKCGESDKVHYLIFEIFRDIEKNRPVPDIARRYCLELFVCIIRSCEIEKIDRYMKGLSRIGEMRTLFEIKEYIFNAANEIAESNKPNRSKNYSKLTRDTLEIIDENIGNENLTLSWIAGNILYTNVDYLGKVFKRETGKNFSAYVMEKRMEIAKTIITADKKDKIYEVAEKVGYGSNSQYFSQVFKKYTGVSPIAYKENPKLEKSG